MSKIIAAAFVAKAEEIAAEGPAYKTGGDGSHGECDCIGLIIGSIRRAGGSWRGLHGSNYAARSEMESLQEIVNSGALVPGEAVYKAWEPSQPKYDLPARYKPGGGSYNGDIRDYYHVGIVVSSSPLRIRHVTSPGGAKMDTSLGSWKYHGKLKKINYAAEDSSSGGGGAKVQQATVVIPSGSKGSTVNLRSAPDQSKKNVLAQVPVGTVVDIVEDQGPWCKIAVQGYTGFMMSNYLEYPGQGEEISGDVLTAEEREKIDNYLLDIENRVEAIRSILGRG